MRTIHTDKYYSIMKHLVDVFEREGRRLGLKAENITEYENWKKSVIEKLYEITGLNRMEICGLEPAMLETVQQEGYRRDKMIIQTEPDVWMTFYVLIPEGSDMHDKLPCIIAPHGHASAGKYATARRTDIPALIETIAEHNYDYGVQFVQQGYIVFCPDARGFGERREYSLQSDSENDFMTCNCSEINRMALSLGQSLTGMWTWDLMRLIDYIETRKDCDPERIGCGGLSGGGLQTLWLAAMDDRVKCAVVSGYFYGYKDSLLKIFNCSCNYIPHLWENVDMCDIGALIAPRPLLIETGDKDPLNGERGLLNVSEQVEITRRAYKIFDAGEKLYHHIFEGKHQWNGEKTFEFFEKWLR